MSFIKKYDVGKAVLDSPYFCYRHNLEMVSFGGLTGRFSVGLSYNSGYDQYLLGNQTNCFNMVNGLKLSLQKKIVQNSGRTFLINENGSFERFTSVSKLDSTRELITNNDGTFDIKDLSGRVEHYNSDGDIVSITQYITPSTSYTVLDYTYSSGKLVQITDRIGRKVVLTYSNNKISKVSLQTAANVEKWYANITYGTNTVTVAMCNNVDIVYNLSNSNLEVYTIQHSGTYNNTYGQKVICEKVSNTEIRVRKLFGSRTDANTSYILINGELDNPNIPILEFLETKNNITNTRTRTQYANMKPQYTYEVVGTDSVGDDMFYMSGSIYRDFKCNVNIAKNDAFLGEIRSYYDQSNRAHISGGTYGLMYNFHDMAFDPEQINFYCLSGWVKPTSSTITDITLSIADSQYGTAFHSVTVSRPSSDTKWRFFQFDFALTSSHGSEWYVRQDSSSFMTLGDVRITRITNDMLYNRGVLVKKVPNGTNDKIYLSDITACQYLHNNTLETDSGSGFYVAVNDINKRLFNLAKDSNDKRLYLRDSSTTVSNCANIRFVVSSSYFSGMIDLDDYNIGYEWENASEKHTTYISYASGTEFRIVYETITCGSNTTNNSSGYNMAGQLLHETKNGITNTYFRNGYGLITKVETSYATNGNKIEKNFSFDTNNDMLTQYTNESGVVTSYSTDSFWGVVLSETCNSVTKAYDYDTNRKSITKVTRTKGTNSFVLDTTETDLVTSGSDNYSLSHLIEGASAVCDEQIAEGRLTKVLYGSTSGSFELSAVTYDDSANSQTDSHAGDTVVYDNYDRAITKRFGTTNELSFEYNVPEDSIANRPGYACDKLTKVTDAVEAVATAITYNSDDLPVQYQTKKTSNNTTVRTTSISYDSLKRTIQEETVVSSKNSKFVYSYKTNLPQEERVHQVKHYLNSTIEAKSTFGYDNFRRVSTHTKNNGGYTMTQSFGYAVSGTRDYNRLATASETLTYGGNTSTLYNVTFGYKADGKLGSLTDSANSGATTVGYEYDDFGRLVRENNKPRNATYVYTYNSNGTLANVKTYAYTTGTLGTPTSTKNCVYNTTYPTRLTSFNGNSITYDTKGRVLTYNGYTYTWGKGRITKYTYGNSFVGTETHTYYYNGKGQRTGKKMMFKKGAQALFAYETIRDEDYTYDDGGRLLKWKRVSTMNDFSTETRYMDFFYDASGVAGCSFYNGTTTAKYYFTKNVFGDIVSVRDASGNVVGTYAYDAFGGCTSSGTSDVLYYNPFRYRGYIYDQDTKLYFLESRYYCPEWHRFLSPDHPSYIDVENLNCLDLYVYCGNDPVNYVDPTGEFPALLAFVLIGAAVGAISYAASEAISYAISSENNWSWGQFIGSIIGGAIGGLLTGLGIGSSWVAFISGASTTFIGLNLSNVIDGTDYSETEIIFRSFFDGISSVVLSNASDKFMINKLTAGRNSFKAISKQMATKTSRRSIKNLAPKTIAKIFAYNIYTSAFELAWEPINQLTNLENMLAQQFV